MSYINDVFISYKRSRINEEWLNTIFLPLFEEYLNNELDFQPIIFVDKTGLTPGVDFANELFKNLIYSKCMVSIWSPPYFRRSEWCVKEFLAMKYRQEQHKLDAFTRPKTLLWPVMYRKIDPLPLAIRNIKYLDYSEYNLIGEAFLKTNRYLKLQQQLQNDIRSITDIILNVPAFDPYWDTPQGREEIIKELVDYYKTNADFDNPPIQKAPQW